MDTFECYCRNKSAVTTINEAAATVLRQAQQPCDSLTLPRPSRRVVVPRQLHYSFACCNRWYSPKKLQIREGWGVLPTLLLAFLVFVCGDGLFRYHYTPRGHALLGLDVDDVNASLAFVQIV